MQISGTGRGPLVDVPLIQASRVRMLSLNDVVA